MAAGTARFLIFRSELFLHRQEDDQIGRWFVGADCGGWLYARLLPLPNIARDVDPLMEDWGWYAGVRVIDSGTRVSIMIYAWDYFDHCWLIGLNAKRRLIRRQSDATLRGALNCVATGIDQIIAADYRFESFGWRDENPFDTGVTDPRK